MRKKRIPIAFSIEECQWSQIPTHIGPSTFICSSTQTRELILQEFVDEVFSSSLSIGEIITSPMLYRRFKPFESVRRDLTMCVIFISPKFQASA
jgi:hypothetical protein